MPVHTRQKRRERLDEFTSPKPDASRFLSVSLGLCFCFPFVKGRVSGRPFQYATYVVHDYVFLFCYFIFVYSHLYFVSFLRLSSRNKHTSLIYILDSKLPLTSSSHYIKTNKETQSRNLGFRSLLYRLLSIQHHRSSSVLFSLSFNLTDPEGHTMSPSAEPLAPLGGATGTIHKTAPAKKVVTSNTTESKLNNPNSNIIDIRQASVEMNLRDEIVSQFCPKKGPRTLPTLLLYDEAGLQLFEDVCCPCFGPCFSCFWFLCLPGPSACSFLFGHILFCCRQDHAAIAWLSSSFFTPRNDRHQGGRANEHAQSSFPVPCHG